MKGRQLRRRFSLQPSFMKDDSIDEKHKRDKTDKHDGDEPRSAAHVRHKIVVLGAAKVGKTSLITQFLYNSFSPKYKRTIEEMHHGNFSVSGVNLTLDILDTSGTYEFPAMRALSISSAEAFILVYDVTDSTTFDEVRATRDQIHEIKGTQQVPMVIVGNKIDLVEEDSNLRQVDCELTESVVTVDWESGFVEASAKDSTNVSQIFKELLTQAKITYNLSPALRRRRQSLPPHQGPNGHHGTPTHTPPVNPSVPSLAQLQHLQRIQEQNIGGKRNSCVIS